MTGTRSIAGVTELLVDSYLVEFTAYDMDLRCDCSQVVICLFVRYVSCADDLANLARDLLSVRRDLRSYLRRRTKSFLNFVGRS